MTQQEHNALLIRLDELFTRMQNGENVDAELRECGQLLGFDEGPKPAGKHKRGQFDPEMVELAKKNGIIYPSFWRRVKSYGWSEWQAATIPPNMGRKRVSENNGGCQYE